MVQGVVLTVLVCLASSCRLQGRRARICKGAQLVLDRGPALAH